MIRRQRRADMGKKHDKHHERQIYNGGTRVYEKAFLEILNKLGFQDKMEMRWLQPNEFAQKSQSLDTVLLLDEKLVKGKEKRLKLSV